MCFDGAFGGSRSIRQVRGIWFKFRTELSTRFIFTTPNKNTVAELVEYSGGEITVRVAMPKLFEAFVEKDSGPNYTSIPWGEEYRDLPGDENRWRGRFGDAEGSQE